jgi:hypothetical protein
MFIPADANFQSPARSFLPPRALTVLLTPDDVASLAGVLVVEIVHLSFITPHLPQPPSSWYLPRFWSLHNALFL